MRGVHSLVPNVQQLKSPDSGGGLANFFVAWLEIMHHDMASEQLMFGECSCCNV